MDHKTDLLKTLITHGTVSCAVLDEIAAAVEAGDEWGPSGTPSNSKRKWKRTLRRNVAMPGFYHASIPTSSGDRLHPFRLPSVKANQLWLQDNHFFDIVRGQNGRIENSGNWLAHPICKAAGLKSVPLSFYGDAVPYVTNKHGKKGSLVCLYFSFPHALPEHGARRADWDCEEKADWMESIHVFTVVRKEDVTTETYDAIWDILCWDLTALRGRGVPEATSR